MRSMPEISKCYVVNTVPSIKSQQFREGYKEETLKEKVND